MIIFSYSKNSVTANMRTFKCSYMSDIFVLFHTETMLKYIMPFHACLMLWVCIMYQLCISTCSTDGAAARSWHLLTFQLNQLQPRRQHSGSIRSNGWHQKRKIAECLFLSGVSSGPDTTTTLTQPTRSSLRGWLTCLVLISAWAAAHFAALQVSRSPGLPIRIDF